MEFWGIFSLGRGQRKVVRKKKGKVKEGLEGRQQEEFQEVGGRVNSVKSLRVVK